MLALPAVGKAQFTFTTNSNGSLNLYQYTGTGGALTIPDSTNGLPITSIGDDAFYQVFGLTSVIIGTNVTKIGTNAFFQCYNLSSVTIPDSVTNIGEGPFIDCQSLTVISLTGSNLYYSSANQLLFNKSQTALIQFPGGVGGSYTIAANVTNIGEAFIGNTLTAISVDPENLYFSSTNGVVFNKNKTALIEYPGAAPGSYTVPGSVTTIVSAAFEYSTGAAAVMIGTSVTSIGEYAFYDCAGLTAISVNPTNLYYSSSNGVLFNKKQTILIQYPCAVAGGYFIAGTVTNIGNGAFGDSFGLTDVVIPDSVTSIGEEAFYSCEGLTNVTFGDGVTSIGMNTFFYCTNLGSLTIPGSVTNIGEEAFAGCESLTNVCFEGNAPVDGGSIFYYDYALFVIDYVNGSEGWGAAYDGIPTEPCAQCASGVPLLAISLSGTNVILTWSANVTGFTLQSAKSLLPQAAWTTVSPPPVIIDGNNTVTNAVADTLEFYRLAGP